MTDILEAIFRSDIYDHERDSEELKSLLKKEVVLFDQLLPEIGLDRIDEITNLQGEIAHEVEFEWFRRGIRLGAALMLELL